MSLESDTQMLKYRITCHLFYNSFFIVSLLFDRTFWRLRCSFGKIHEKLGKNCSRSLQNVLGRHNEKISCLTKVNNPLKRKTKYDIYYHNVICFSWFYIIKLSFIRRKLYIWAQYDIFNISWMKVKKVYTLFETLWQ